MFAFAAVSLSVGLSSGVDIVDNSGQDALNLLQLRASISKVDSAKSTCNGLVPANGIVMECEFPWPVWFNGNQQSDQCIGENNGYTGQLGSGGGSWCLSKEAPNAGLSIMKDTRSNYGPDGRAMIQCTPACPGYVEPFQDVTSAWQCPNGLCNCRADGDPHIRKTFRGHHIDWQGYGIYNYAETKAGERFHAAQCKQPVYGRDYRKLSAEGTGEKTPYTEIFALAYHIKGHDVVVMKMDWIFKDGAGQTFPPGKGGKYEIRIDNHCYRWGWTRGHPTSLKGVDCTDGSIWKPEDDLGLDNIAGGDFEMVKPYDATYMYFRTSTDITFYVHNPYALHFEVPQDQLRNAGACANKHMPGFPDRAEDSPWDGAAVPLNEMIFNELELDYICNWWCGLPEDKENGFKLCDPPASPVPKEPTPEKLCDEQDVSFEDAQTRCANFDQVLLHDCLFDYCATGGDERFIVADEEEKEREEIADALITPAPLTPPVVECGHEQEKLDFSSLVSNNLGGTGPKDGEQMMRFSQVRAGVDMTITCKPYSNVKRSSRNLVGDGIAAINIPPRSSPECTFQFVQTGTTTPQLMTNVGLSFLDLDQGKKAKKGFEAVTICDADVVSSGDGSELSQSKDGQGCDRFQSSSWGTGKDNPTSVTELTALQKSRTASAYWATTSSFTVTMENTMRSARPIMFTGAALECL